MTTTDYLIDSALVLLVLLQLKERKLTTRTLVRPLLLLGIAVVDYLHGIPTTGNDIPLILALSVIGGVIGVLSGVTVMMRSGPGGEVLARAGLASAVLWVLGMGSRFAFAVWASHGGAQTIGRFSLQHSLTLAPGNVWTVALLAMAVFEVLGRTLVLAARRQQLAGRPLAAVA